MCSSDLPLVSVCLITYNHEPYITEAIENVLAQKTAFSYELVIGDDYSTDRTYFICLDWEKKYPDIIRLHRNSKNEGFMNNFRISCNRCKGKYIAFCEGDDYWIDNLKLQKQIDFLETNLTYGLVFTDFYSFIQSNTQFHKTSFDLSDCDYAKLLAFGNNIATVSVCCRSSYVHTFFELFNDHLHLWMMADLPLWLYISQYTSLKYMNEVTCVYRILPESASHTNNKKKEFLFQKSIFEISLYFEKRHRLDFTSYRYFFYKRFYNWMVYTGDLKSVKEALLFFIQNMYFIATIKAVICLFFWKQKKLITLTSFLKK